MSRLIVGWRRLARLALVLSGLLPLALLGGCDRPLTHKSLDFGHFGAVSVLYHRLDAKRVIIVSSDNPGQASVLAATLADKDAMVIITDAGRFSRALNQEGGDCSSFGYDFEALSQYVQKSLERPNYSKPVLAGDGLGAALVLAAANQSQPGSFAAILAGRFCPRWPLTVPPCSDDGLTPDQAGFYPATPKLSESAQILSLLPGCEAPAGRFLAGTPAASHRPGGNDTPATWAKAMDGLIAAESGGLPLAISDLPLTLVPVPKDATPDPREGRRFALFLSGDGGWVGLDRAVADALARRGIPVLGLDSLRYFWKTRNPADTAATVTKIIDAYGKQSGRDQVLLFGYSFGADVIPTTLLALNAATRPKIESVVLLGAGPTGDFEFHIGSWMSNGPQSAAAVDNIAPFKNNGLGVPVLCVYGADDADDSLCPKISGNDVTSLRLEGGHHFDGDYDKLARIVLDHVK